MISSHKKSVSQTTTGANEKASVNENTDLVEDAERDPVGVIQPIIRKERKDSASKPTD